MHEEPDAPRIFSIFDLAPACLSEKSSWCKIQARVFTPNYARRAENFRFSARIFRTHAPPPIEAVHSQNKNFCICLQGGGIPLYFSAFFAKRIYFLLFFYNVLSFSAGLSPGNVIGFSSKMK